MTADKPLKFLPDDPPKFNRSGNLSPLFRMFCGIFSKELLRLRRNGDQFANISESHTAAERLKARECLDSWWWCGPKGLTV